MYVNMDDNETNWDNLNKIYKRICNIFTNVKQNVNSSIDELIDLYSQDDSFLKDMSYIDESLSEINDILSPVYELEDEYLCFFSIKLMIDFLINDVKLFIIYLSFIEDLLINFFNLIHLKLLKTFNYEKIYNEFFVYLEKQKEFFYTKIHDYDSDYQKLIVEINNLMW